MHREGVGITLACACMVFVPRGGTESRPGSHIPPASCLQHPQDYLHCYSSGSSLLLVVVVFPKQQSCTYSFSRKRCTRIPDRPCAGVHLVSMPQWSCEGHMQERAVLSVFSQLQEDSEQTPKRVLQNTVCLSKSGCCGGHQKARFLYRFHN